MNCGGSGSFLCENPDCETHTWTGQAKARLVELLALRHVWRGDAVRCANVQAKLANFVIDIADRRAVGRPLTFRSKIEEKTIDFATKWWTDQLLGRREDLLLPRVPSHRGLKEALDLNRRNRPVSKEQIATFTEHLSAYLRETIAMDGTCYGTYFILRTDYEAQGALLDIAKASKIEPFQFPTKTWMHVHPEHVKVGKVLFGDASTWKGEA